MSLCRDCAQIFYPHFCFLEGIDPEFGMHTLFLPVQDGNIPRLEQLDIFRKHGNFKNKREI